MDEIIDELYNAGIYVNLATPSGARPHWLANEYPEVLRVDDKGLRAHFGGRHNQCSIIIFNKRCANLWNVGRRDGCAI